MSTYLGTQLLSGIATNTISNAHDLFDFKWTDHILNEINWLRADTFSWQSGAVYVAAYNHLSTDYTGGISKTETIGSYTISYIEADDGHKITTDEQTVADIYNESGVAWYYVLDTTNQRFKLPRTKYGFTGFRDAVGKYIEAGLPNIYGTLGSSGGNGVWGAFDATGAFSVSGAASQRASNGSSVTKVVTLDASEYNSIYGNSTTVQPPATQMYLYFYVGQFSQSATEQTAGVTTETLNGKAGVDLDNLSQAGQALFTAKLDADKIQYVNTLPASPVAGTLYLIPE